MHALREYPQSVPPWNLLTLFLKWSVTCVTRRFLCIVQDISLEKGGVGAMQTKKLPVVGKAMLGARLSVYGTQTGI